MYLVAVGLKKRVEAFTFCLYIDKAELTWQQASDKSMELTCGTLTAVI